MSGKKRETTPEISVVMSVYNEKDDDLLTAVKSVLGQTYTDFEFIIICDNPDDDRIRRILKDIEKSDERIKVIWNEKNMGLARSLNNGCNEAVGKYIVRMDADDVSRKDRIEKQVKFIKKEGCDLVCTSYDCIDESGKLIGSKSVVYYPSDEIKKALPYKNIIHHPTTMFSKCVFEEAGAYRNFPCSQDYDLWLRMLDVGAKMSMLNEPLLYYRIRRDSVTSRKRYRQACTLNYIRKLYCERRRWGCDLYSIENYEKYMRKFGVGNKKSEKLFKITTDNIKKGKTKIKKGKLFSGFAIIATSIIRSKYYRQQIWLYLKQRVRKIGA